MQRVEFGLRRNVVVAARRVCKNFWYPVSYMMGHLMCRSGVVLVSGRSWMVVQIVLGNFGGAEGIDWLGWHCAGINALFLGCGRNLRRCSLQAVDRFTRGWGQQTDRSLG